MASVECPCREYVPSSPTESATTQTIVVEPNKPYGGVPPFLYRVVFDAISQTVGVCGQFYADDIPAEAWEIDYSGILGKAVAVAQRIERGECRVCGESMNGETGNYDPLRERMAHIRCVDGAGHDLSSSRAPSAEPPSEPTHELKVWPQYADALDSGVKTFEFRRDDRPFAVGDTLRLNEWEPEPCDHVRRSCEEIGCHGMGYTGRYWDRRITYIARGGVIPAGFCVMSVVPLSEFSRSALVAEAGHLREVCRKQQETNSMLAEEVGRLRELMPTPAEFRSLDNMIPYDGQMAARQFVNRVRDVAESAPRSPSTGKANNSSKT